MRNRLPIALLLMTTIVTFAALPPTAGADHPTPLGGLNLAAYCVTEGYAGVVLTKPVAGPNAARNNWRCVTAEGKTHPFSFEQACKWQYNLNAVQAHPADPDNAFTWVCFTTEHV